MPSSTSNFQSVLPNQWYPCFLSKDLKKKPLTAERLGKKLVLWRSESQIHCFFDRCPHRGISFARGKVVQGELQCPFHGFRFDSAGECTAIPCIGSKGKIPKKMKLEEGFIAKEAYGLIWLWSGPEAPIAEPPWFDKVEKSENWTSTADVSQIWENNAVKLTESFFDLHHVHWVHNKTIPGIGPLVSDYSVSVEENHIITAGKLGHEGKEKKVDFTIELKFPNLQYISLKGLYFLVSATPINEKQSWIWARYQQDMLPIPGLGYLLAWFLAWGDFGILQAREDRPLLDTIDPPIPTPGADCYVLPDKGGASFLRLFRQKQKEFQASSEAPK